MKLTSLFSFLNKMGNSFVKFYYKNSPKNLKLEKAGNSNQDLFHTATLLFSSDCNFLADLSFTRPRLTPISIFINSIVEYVQLYLFCKMFGTTCYLM